MGETQVADETGRFGFDFQLEHICSYMARLDPVPEVIGPVPEGLRTNWYVTGGEVSGPRLRGIVRPVGGDWFILRTDGVGVLDVRATIETHDGALLYVAYSGVADLGEGGYERFLRGEASGVVPLRCAPRFQTAHPAYLWINRLQCLSIGQADLERAEVSYDVYALC